MNDILELLKKDLNNIDLYHELQDYHPCDLAKVYKDYPDLHDRFVKIFSPKEMGEILAYLDLDYAQENLKQMDPLYASMMLEKMPLDDAKELLDGVENQDQYYKLMDEDQANEIKEAIKYPSDSAAAIMSDDFLYINNNLTIKEAMKILIKYAPRKEYIDTLYIVDDNYCLMGIVKLNDLICARDMNTLDDIMDKDFIYLEAFDNHDNVISMIKKYGLASIPVLDNGVMKGIISADDVMDIIDIIREDDYAKMSSADVDVKGVLETVKARLPWLCLLMILSMVVSTILGSFEKVIQELTVLVFFQTLVLDMAGNSATQSLAISVLDLSKSKKINMGKRLKKEFKIGVFDGILLGLISFLVTLVFLTIRDNTYNPIYIGIIVGISIFLGNTFSCIIGALFPNVLAKLKIDPAVASGPFISTVNDIMSVSVYYSVALIFLKMAVI